MKNISHIQKYYQQKALTYGISPQREFKIVESLTFIHGCRILDIGCATGYLGYKLKQNNNYIIGVDISSKAIMKAKKILDEAYTIDIEQQTIPIRKKVDVIIIPEVIEHLFLPEQTLRGLLKHLKSGGIMLISTPNLLYWGNRIQFLRGKFSYTRCGIFDESHIHFFTHATVKNLGRIRNLTIFKENHIGAGSIGNLLLAKYPNILALHLIFLFKKS